VNIAIVPARGGSRRIPRKNVRPFCGRPMIAWTIDALRDSGCVDRIVVSTDDDEIAALATSLGAEVPFRRPAALADDHAPTLPVIADALQRLDALGWRAQRVCCAYATAPLMAPNDVRAARERLDADADLDYVFSCATYAFPVRRALRHGAGGGVEPLFAESIGRRSQDLDEVFHDAGQFYWGRPAAFAQQRPIFGAHSRPHFVPRHRVQDIDTAEDWARAELLFRAFKELHS
jgi:pseudaminic acid cytidylyltransferase